jgi:type IX secretion system PorP/SprF family membrane protein
MRCKFYISIFLFFGCTLRLFSQDPHFSQFFMAQSLVNPGLTGSIDGDWRAMTNIRQQWGNAGTPFNTYVLSADIRINGLSDGKNHIGAGMSILSDDAMNGAFRSVYANAGMAYHLGLSEGTSLSLGFNGAYGNRIVKYDRLTFGEQYVNGGFDITLPSGETALVNMKPFFSLSSGVVFTTVSDKMRAEIGLSGFHLNRPVQTFTLDERQRIPMRYSGHATLELSLNDRLILNAGAIYQRQANQDYLGGGGGVGLDLTYGARERILFAGLWYRSRDVIYPFVGLKLNNLQFGFSYDFTVSRQVSAGMMPRSIELSFLIRDARQAFGLIACPWR